MAQLELPEELLKRFEEAKERLLVRLRQIPATQLQRYGGSIVELYPESSYFPGDGPDYHGGLYLMANGEFVGKSMMQGHPFPATPISFIRHYLLDFDEKYKALFNESY